jgi:NAD(P)-dependent dehydrogenase (short-subunit alcohol dehydrogenase family)
VDVLIHNAGALFNKRREAADGTEATCQITVVAPFLMTALLLGQVQSAEPGRVITMSSGGMYTAPLTVADLEMSDENYSGPKQYARAKRAQVVLNEMWAERVPSDAAVFHALHPGWADTPGVAGALPGFRRIVRPLLRTPLQGADTMVWLAAEPTVANVTGAFWLDRAVRSTHKLKSTRESDTDETRQALWDWCVERSGASVAEGA